MRLSFFVYLILFILPSTLQAQDIKALDARIERLENRGNYSTALEVILKKLVFYEQANDFLGQIETLNQIGDLNRNQQNYREAIDVLGEARALAQIHQIKHIQTAYTYAQMAAVYFEMNDFPRSKTLATQALEYEATLPFSQFTPASIRLRILAQNILASCLREQGFYDEALQQGKDALRLSRRLNDSKSLINVTQNVATIYYKQNHYLRAVDLAKESLTLARRVGTLRQQQQSYAILANIYAATGGYQQAYEHLRLSTMTKGLLYTQYQDLRLAELQTRFRTQKKQQIIDQMELEASLKERQQQIIGSLLGVVLFLFLLVFYQFNRQRRLNKRLAQKTHAIEQKNIELQNISGELQAALAEKVVLLREIHHRVKNNLQIISSLLSLQSYDIQDPQLLKILREGQQRIKSMALLHQKLYQTENISHLQFAAYAHELLSNLAASYASPNKPMHYEVHGDGKLSIDAAVPIGLIINELATNSFKYAFQDVDEGLLSLHFSQSESSFKLQMRDNGKGLPDDFDFENASNLGLRIVRILVAQLDGNFNYYNDNGSVFELEVMLDAF